MESGKYRVMHQGKSLLANDIEAGQCFGEASLLSGQSNIRQADVVTIETGMLMRLAKADFVEHLGHLEDVKNMWRMVALRKVQLPAIPLPFPTHLLPSFACKCLSPFAPRPQLPSPLPP